MSRVQALDLSVDAMVALLWQHDNAEKLKTLVRLKQEWYVQAQQEFWQNWIVDVFNIDTANDFGLAVWARILNVPMSVTSPADVGKVAFGFGASNANFERGNFGNLNPNDIGLTTEQRRLIIRLRYFQLTARGVVTETNEFLAEVFAGQGRVFVADPYDMSFVTYFFEQAPDAQTKFILDNYDLLPRPAGVGVKYAVQPRYAFGFGPSNANFQNGNFGA